MRILSSYASQLLLVLLLSLTACKKSQQDQMKHAHTNALINETSPYLLQHAHNPVNWEPWSDKVLQKAQEDDKLVIVSIGYSSCHWCHVMEEESFEDSAVASLMNKKFINIKVDREERPDVDNVYMNAVQLMTGRGGWPLNVITLPDGRPVWGGTYFPKENWIDALNQIATLKQEQPEKLEEYATRLSEGLKQMNLITTSEGEQEFTNDSISLAVEKWSQSFDTIQGGMRRAPKFMMPNNYQFLLRFAYQNNDTPILNFVHKTLQQMAYGGVYDQIGGGFARYSTDEKWHIPHFEKMLYDNAQLLSLYSDAYLLKPDPLYKETVFETISFLKREMLDESGGFYSALDADSKNAKDELEEGAYYVWTKDELKNLLNDDFDLFSKYYNTNEYGYWENDNYVLIRQDSDQEFVEENNLDLKNFKIKKEQWQENLLRFREKKPAPRLDDKILTGWNGLLIAGLVDAYRVFEEQEFLDLALKNANFIKDNQIRKDGGLNRNYKNGKSSINAYLEDYASTIDAFIKLFEITGDSQWLNLSQNLTQYTVANFTDKKSGMFYFTSDKDAALITRSVELMDNVIPASNSMMAKNLFKLSHLTFNMSYSKRAGQMLHNVTTDATSYASSYSNWFDLMINFTNPFYEIVVVGPKAQDLVNDLNENYLSNAVIAWTSQENNNLDLFENRFNADETYIYVCENNSCKLPVKTADSALKLLEN